MVILMKLIEHLVEEHRNIKTLLGIVRKACLNILEGGDVDTGDFHIFIEFIRLYADKSHHGKEEAILFDEMEKRLGSVAQTLIHHGMLVEHDLARLYVSQLETALHAYEAYKDSGSKLDLISYAMAYADLLHRHIKKEDEVVYPFAERTLSPEVLAQLEGQSLAFEAENEEIRKLQLEHLKKLALKYPV